MEGVVEPEKIVRKGNFRAGEANVTLRGTGAVLGPLDRITDDSCLTGVCVAMGYLDIVAGAACGRSRAGKGVEKGDTTD